MNVNRGRFSDTAIALPAGLCGLDPTLVATNTTNKGQCIQVLRTRYYPK